MCELRCGAADVAAPEIGAVTVTFELDRGGGGGRALRIGGFELRDAFKETFAELALL
jgi:hypothetical protein